MNIKEKVKKALTQEEIMKALDVCYHKAIDGIEHISPPIEQLAKNYLDKNPNESIAAKRMINSQIAKCTTSGFITGFGGVITLPISIPANIGSVLYVQMRMIACTAYLAGLELDSDQVQTLVYACLAGVAVNEIVKKTGVKFGEKLAVNLIKKIPGEALTKINQKVGFRFLTKFGEKGLINMGKLVPVVGAVINGSFDLVETKIIGNRAYKWFFQSDLSINGDDSTNKDEFKSNDIVDIDDFTEEYD